MFGPLASSFSRWSRALLPSPEEISPTSRGILRRVTMVSLVPLSCHYKVLISSIAACSSINLNVFRGPSSLTIHILQAIRFLRLNQKKISIYPIRRCTDNLFAMISSSSFRHTPLVCLNSRLMNETPSFWTVKIRKSFKMSMKRLSLSTSRTSRSPSKRLVL